MAKLGLLLTGADLDSVLEACRTVAIVGLSRDPAKDSRRAAELLVKRGFKVIPINPYAKTLEGESCYRSVLNIPPQLSSSVDLVAIYRPGRDVPSVLEQCRILSRKHHRLKAVWIQATTGTADEYEIEPFLVIQNLSLLSELEKRIPHRRESN